MLKTGHITTVSTGPEHAWVKSSYSNAGQNCVEVAGFSAESIQVGVRDSKQANGPAFLVPATAWTAFILGIQDGRLGPAAG